MASSVSNLVNNLSERIRRIKCKYRHDDKKFKTYGMKYMYCNCVLEYTSFKDHLIKCKCLYCNNIYERKFDQKLKERFFNTYKLSNHDNNSFYCSEEIFILTNVWMILKKKIFIVI